MPVVTVPLGDRSYPILVAPSALAQVGALVVEHAAPPSALVVSNPRIAGLYADQVIASLRAAGVRTDLTVVPPGERSKTWAVAGRLLDVAVQQRLERSSAIIALGGGVVGDLAGFVAAIYLRGVSLVQVPTSLLAQVDASVGGKTAVDHPAGKNLIGSFHQPKLVVIDPCVLASLPARELRSGLAEMIKHGVILSAEYFALLDELMSRLVRRDPEALTAAVVGSCELKAAVVAADERESGRRALLNYGHTFGHALEAATRFRRYTHGEAVSIGMEMAALLARDLGTFSAADAGRQHALLRAARLPTRVHPALAVGPDDLMAAMQRDKKVSGGRVRFVLPTRIGAGEIVKEVPAAAVRNVCERFLAERE